MSAIFVTGTDTGVGKTLVSKALVEYYISQGLNVSAMKPIASGAEKTPSGLRNEDADILLNAINTNFSYSQINPYVFEPPIAPHIAANREGVEIDPNVLNKAYEQLLNNSDKVIVEGAGGWQVPLNKALSLADWVSTKKWPVILVVGIRLGCINHARLTYLDILSKKNPLLGWVANIVEPDVSNVDEIIEALSESIAAPMLGKIPFLTQAQRTDLTPYLPGLATEIA